MPSRVRVWDIPTRLFHWSLVLLMVFSFVTAHLGGNWMRWHFYSGYCILTLILFRVLWGFCGGRYARFRSFLFSPRQIIDYLRQAPGAVKTLGHNPLGSVSVFALLFFVGFQATTGLFSNDDISEQGPLVRYISEATSALMTKLHKLNEKVLIALVLLHLGAILFYLLARRENLIRPMIHGDKEAGDAADAAQASRDDPGMWLRALAVALISVAIVTGIVNWPWSAG